MAILPPMANKWICSVLLLGLAGCRSPLPVQQVPYTLLAPAAPGGLPLDSKDHQPVLLGVTNRAAILAHRDIYRENTAKTLLTPAMKARWKAIDVPVTLVVAMASWCGDTQRELPDLLALMETPNPFVQVHFIGVWRDKRLPPGAWPVGFPQEQLDRVPTFWCFVLQPGGGQRCVGRVVESPPIKGQSMAEALLDLMERAG